MEMQPQPQKVCHFLTGKNQMNCLILARSTRKRRLMSILLCCLTVSNHNRPKSTIYSPKNESLAPEVSFSSIRLE